MGGGARERSKNPSGFRGHTASNPICTSRHLRCHYRMLPAHIPAATNIPFTPWAACNCFKQVRCLAALPVAACWVLSPAAPPPPKR